MVPCGETSGETISVVGIDDNYNKRHFDLYNLRSAELTSRELRDALNTTRGIGLSMGSNETVDTDIHRKITQLQTYEDCELLVISSDKYRTSFIENKEAVAFITSARGAYDTVSNDEPFYRFLRRVRVPASGIPASVAGWLANTFMYGPIPTEAFVISALTSTLAATINVGRRMKQDYKRGMAIKNLFHAGWEERELFYPRTDAQAAEWSPIEFSDSEKISIDGDRSEENWQVWQFGGEKELVYAQWMLDSSFAVSITPRKLFLGILDTFPDDRAELWENRLREDMVFFRSELDGIKRLNDEDTLLTETEDFTGIKDETKRTKIQQAIKGAEARMVVRTFDILSVLREREQARQARERALELEKANQENVAIYDSVGRWAQTETYPAETRRDIQTLLNGAIGLKDDFISKYGTENGLRGIVEFDAYTRRAVQLLSEGASFDHIYEGMVNKFGEAVERGQDVEPQYAIVIPPLEDFQRLYAPEHEQRPVGVFGELYPNAFYQLAASMPSEATSESTEADLR